MAKKVVKTTEIATQESVKLENFQNIKELTAWADTIIEGGLLPDAIDTPEQVITIVQQGKELGLSPLTALNNIHVIAGRPVISSAMLGALLKRQGVEWIIKEDYVYFGEEDEDGGMNARTTYTFFWKSEVTGRVMEADFAVTWYQMETAGYTTKQNWQKYPKEMLRARCLSYAVRALFPDVLLGMYSDVEFNDVAEDLGGDEKEVRVTEDGEIILDITD